MDPLTATSLAGTIAQFVDLGCKLTSSTYQISKSAEGATLSNLDLTKVTYDLDLINKKLKRDLSERGKSDKDKRQNPSDEEKAERQLIHECSNVATEVHQTLAKVVVGNRTGKWRSFRQALLSVWHAERIDGLEKRLVRFREQLVFRILVSLRFVGCSCWPKNMCTDL